MGTEIQSSRGGVTGQIFLLVRNGHVHENHALSFLNEMIDETR